MGDLEPGLQCLWYCVQVGILSILFQILQSFAIQLHGSITILDNDKEIKSFFRYCSSE